METKPSYRHPLSGRIKQLQVVVVAGLLGLSSLAHAGLFSDTEARSRIDALVQENAGLKRQLATLQASVAALEQKSKAQMDLSAQMDLLRDQVAKLTGQDELLSYSLDTADKRQKDAYVALDARLRELEKARELSAAVKPAKADPGADLAAYNAAFDLVQGGNFKQAISALEGFLRQYPDSTYAANAQYWIGNSFGALGDHKAASDSHRKLLEAYPQSDKVPDSLLNLAQALEAQGSKAEATRLLKDLVKKHPASNAARQAQTRLKTAK